MHIGTQGPAKFTMRCTIKISFIVRDDLVDDFIKAIKAFFKQIKKSRK